MISIRCSMLEAVRKNPAAYGQLLASNDGKKGGGSHGMFACFQDVARLYHTGEIDLKDGIRELHRKFLRFNETEENKTKQAKLVEQFVRYCRSFEKQSFELVEGWRQMKWSVVPNVLLTGRTPWVVGNDDGYFSYILSEQKIDWKSELRFPLFQKYLTDNTIDCSLNEMSVGIYCLTTNTFDFKSYSAKEVTNVVNETGLIFQNVYTEYKKSSSK